MNTKRLFSTLVLGLGLTLALLWLLVLSGAEGLGGRPSVAHADPGALYVAPGGTDGGNNCTNSGTPCATVQHAVDAAGPGDEIRVAAGAYTGVSARAGITQVVYISQTVTIRGGYTTANWTTADPVANPTTLDAQGQGRVFYVTGDIAFTIEGLRITGGDATGMDPDGWDDVGGGVYVYRANTTIVNCVVISNTASTPSTGYGGGLYLEDSDVTLNGNTVQGNTASERGGGMYLNDSNAILNGNTIYNNTTGNRGGGACVFWSNVTLSSNAIYSNTTGNQGGGLYFAYTNGALSGNIISGNIAFFGGGLYLSSSAPTLTNDVVADNQVINEGVGSGLYIEASSPHLLHNTIARNSGGDGSGVYVTNNYYGESSTVAMTNTIIVSHTVGITVTTGNTATLDATLWHANTDDNWGGAGSISTSNDHSGDPAFAPDGYHLTFGSAAIDRGVDAGVTTDIDGEARPWGAGYDIGADEYQATRLYLPLILRNF